MSRTGSEDETRSFLDHYSNESKEYLPVFTLANAKTPQHNSGWMRRRYLILTVLMSGTLSVLATLASQQIFPGLFHPNNKNNLSSLPDFSVPAIGNMMKTYEFEPIFVQQPSNETNKAWADLIPKGKGFISLEKLEAAGEVPQYIRDMSTNGTGKFCVSAFHQLHCLYMLRYGYFAAMEGNTESAMHTMHCFAYLRQSIMCAADSSLEPFKTEFAGVDGYGSPHQCRDYNALYGWAEKYRYSDSDGI